jgi:hypothetical protein
LGISKIRATGQLPQAGRIVGEREVRVSLLSRPDACRPFELAKKRAPEIRSLFFHTVCTKAAVSFAQRCEI